MGLQSGSISSTAPTPLPAYCPTWCAATPSTPSKRRGASPRHTQGCRGCVSGAVLLPCQTGGWAEQSDAHARGGAPMGIARLCPSVCWYRVSGNRLSPRQAFPARFPDRRPPARDGRVHRDPRSPAVAAVPARGEHGRARHARSSCPAGPRSRSDGARRGSPDCRAGSGSPGSGSHPMKGMDGVVGHDRGQSPAPLPGYHEQQVKERLALVDLDHQQGSERRSGRSSAIADHPRRRQRRAPAAGKETGDGLLGVLPDDARPASCSIRCHRRTRRHKTGSARRRLQARLAPACWTGRPGPGDRSVASSAWEPRAGRCARSRPSIRISSRDPIPGGGMYRWSLGCGGFS